MYLGKLQKCTDKVKTGDLHNEHRKLASIQKTLHYKEVREERGSGQIQSHKMSLKGQL